MRVSADGRCERLDAFTTRTTVLVSSSLISVFAATTPFSRIVNPSPNRLVVGVGHVIESEKGHSFYNLAV
jgi:hypothetical protein